MVAVATTVVQGQFLIRLAARKRGVDAIERDQGHDNVPWISDRQLLQGSVPNGGFIADREHTASSDVCPTPTSDLQCQWLQSLTQDGIATPDDFANLGSTVPVTNHISRAAGRLEHLDIRRSSGPAHGDHTNKEQIITGDPSYPRMRGSTGHQGMPGSCFEEDEEQRLLASITRLDSLLQKGKCQSELSACRSSSPIPSSSDHVGKLSKGPSISSDLGCWTMDKRHGKSPTRIGNRERRPPRAGLITKSRVKKEGKISSNVDLSSNCTPVSKPPSTLAQDALQDEEQHESHCKFGANIASVPEIKYPAEHGRIADNFRYQGHRYPSRATCVGNPSAQLVREENCEGDSLHRALGLSRRTYLQHPCIAISAPRGTDSALEHESRAEARGKYPSPLEAGQWPEVDQHATTPRGSREHRRNAQGTLPRYPDHTDYTRNSQVMAKPHFLPFHHQDGFANRSDNELMADFGDHRRGESIAVRRYGDQYGLEEHTVSPGRRWVKDRCQGGRCGPQERTRVNHVNSAHLKTPLHAAGAIGVGECSV